MNIGKIDITGAMEVITIDIDKLLDSIGYSKIRAYLDFKEGEELRKDDAVELAQPNYRGIDLTNDIKYEILESEEIVDGGTPDNPEPN
jgi:hypothetical protein